jgi:hypothetical protein
MYKLWTTGKYQNRSPAHYRPASNTIINTDYPRNTKKMKPKQEDFLCLEVMIIMIMTNNTLSINIAPSFLSVVKMSTKIYKNAI